MYQIQFKKKLTEAIALVFLSLLKNLEDFLAIRKAFFMKNWTIFIAKTGDINIRQDALITSLKTFVNKSNNPLIVLQQSLDVFVIADFLWKFLWLDIGKTVS